MNTLTILNPNDDEALESIKFLGKQYKVEVSDSFKKTEVYVDEGRNGYTGEYFCETHERDLDYITLTGEDKDIDDFLASMGFTRDTI